MSMNIFRLTGDICHMVSIVLLLLLAFYHKDGRGLSFRSQELFLLTFLTRYLDLFTTFYSLYNSAVKCFYIGSTAALLYQIQRKNKDGSCVHDAARDIFPHVSYLVLPCCIIATVTHLVGGGTRNFDTLELLWTFSIYMEAVAILPQLVLLQKYRKIQPRLAHAILCIGLYRALYIVNWIYRSHTEKGYRHHWVVYGCGILQTVLYSDFFYSYMMKYKTNEGANDTLDDSNQDENEESQDSSHNHLSYEPALQNKVCCCNHVAKTEEESTPGEPTDMEDSDSSSSSQSVPSHHTNPPMLLFKGPALVVLVSICIMWICILVPLLGVVIVIACCAHKRRGAAVDQTTAEDGNAKDLEVDEPMASEAGGGLNTPLLAAETPSSSDQKGEETIP